MPSSRQAVSGSCCLAPWAIPPLKGYGKPFSPDRERVGAAM